MSEWPPPLPAPGSPPPEHKSGCTPPTAAPYAGTAPPPGGAGGWNAGGAECAYAGIAPAPINTQGCIGHADHQHGFTSKEAQTVRELLNTRSQKQGELRILRA
uniref:Uncharacterized protein n=1 Tax=Pristionchus pacificus TaxID=54126 RepID=A0A2A6C149_PRIPA|eukprot:PDM71827.1 hypothetical protein PRIPAC_38234 [Pristionchus pacificus]